MKNKVYYGEYTLKHWIKLIHLPEVEDDTIWEDDRNKFLKLIEKKK